MRRRVLLYDVARCCPFIDDASARCRLCLRGALSWRHVVKRATARRAATLLSSWQRLMAAFSLRRHCCHVTLMLSPAIRRHADVTLQNAAIACHVDMLPLPHTLLYRFAILFAV